jgi:hypothetical protein
VLLLCLHVTYDAGNTLLNTRNNKNNPGQGAGRKYDAVPAGDAPLVKPLADATAAPASIAAAPSRLLNSLATFVAIL